MRRGAFVDMVSPAGPWALRVAATLGLADLIASGITRVDELASAAGADEDSLARLLRYLSSRGIFTELEPGVFGPTAAARVLEEGHPTRLRAWLDLEGAGGRMDAAWEGLLESVRTGRSSYAALRGQSFWDELASEPALAASFASLMALGSARIAREISTVYDWTPVRHVVDVGGGSGTLIASLLRAHPWLRGTLVDLQRTAAAATDVLSAEGVADRCSIVGGSFFDPLPQGGDVYVLANVLHDWADDTATRILKRCAEAAGDEGRVLIVERLMDVGRDVDGAENDLRLLVVFGGRVRDVPDFRRLAEAVGMKVRSVERAPSGCSFVECACFERECPRVGG